LTTKALRRIGELYAIEESIRENHQTNGSPVASSMPGHCSPTLSDACRLRSPKSDTAAAILYSPKLWPALTR